MNTMKRSDSAIATRQRGVVLVISLLLLLVITLMGMSSLGTTALEEKMTSNMQAKHVVFQAADTTIEEAVDNTDFLWKAYGKGLNPADLETFQPTMTLYASFAEDKDGDAVPLQLSAQQVTAEFKGNTIPVGDNATSIRMGAAGYHLYHYYLEGTAELDGHSARAVHVQGAHLKGAALDSASELHRNAAASGG
jgi:Na+-transporting methylmalonyl-CoA/oxaloacetate decarboxylase gamma subunit